MESREIKNQSNNDLKQFEAIERLFNEGGVRLIEKIEAFPKYVSRQSMAKFLTKYELFKQILHVNGSIIECGVLHGAGLLSWAKLSSILEPTNHTRKIIGFDSFEGFISIQEQDRGGDSSHLVKGGLTGSTFEDVQKAVEVYDMNRSLQHIQKVELIRGDFCKTVNPYVEIDNPHLVVSLLYLDFDLYEPTKKAIEMFVPRMPKGAIIVFDELNAKMFPGETMAVQETLGLKNLEIKRFVFDSYVSYAVLK